MMPGIRTMFLIDGCGAVLSALMLGVVLPNFPQYVGLPTNILHFLSGFAMVFIIVSLGAFFLKIEHPALLRGVALANVAYAFISVGTLVAFRSSLTVWDLCYFVGEILILATMVYVEFRVFYTTKAQLYT